MSPILQPVWVVNKKSEKNKLLAPALLRPAQPAKGKWPTPSALNVSKKLKKNSQNHLQVTNPSRLKNNFRYFTPVLF